MTGGVTFAVVQFACSNYISVELTDIAASLLSIAAMVAFLKVWQPADPLHGDRFSRPAIAGAAVHDPVHEAQVRRREGTGRDSRGDVFGAYAPYLIIIVVFGLSQIGPIKDLLAHGEKDFSWPGLHILNSKGEAPSSVTYKFNWLPAAGTLLLICGLLTMLVLRVSPARAVSAYVRTLDQLKWATLTVMAVLALAYVMNQSGQTNTLGAALAATGGTFVVLSPILGWIGTAVTGSDTSANALFGALQVQTAAKAGLDPVLLAAANSSGGVLGKMISPQNLAIAASAVGMAGKEGDIFRRVVLWSVVLLLIMCAIVALQGTPVLGWMIPN
jgi:lactate permease